MDKKHTGKMVSLRIPEDLQDRLDNLSNSTGRTKTYYVKKALRRFLEDQEDYLLAVSVLEEGGEFTDHEAVKELVKNKKGQ